MSTAHPSQLKTPFERSVDHYLAGLLNVSTGPSHACKECMESSPLPDGAACPHCGEVLDEDSDEMQSWYDCASEGGFSSSQCDSCGSRLGGNRYSAHAWRGPTGKGRDSWEEELIHLSVCGDCLCYLANGDVPKNWEG